MGAAITVEMGETRVSRAPDDRLVAFGLGACVGLCLYDPIPPLAAMVHIVLPETLPAATRPGALPPPLPGKCADTALGDALAQMRRQGAQAARIRAAIVGGAQIFIHSSAGDEKKVPDAALSRLEIGPRNVAAVKALLADAGIPLAAAEVGGHCGRTVTFCVGSGAVHVRPIGGEERLLIALGAAAPPPSGMPERTMRDGR